MKNWNETLSHRRAESYSTANILVKLSYLPLGTAERHFETRPPKTKDFCFVCLLAGKWIGSLNCLWPCSFVCKMYQKERWPPLWSLFEDLRTDFGTCFVKNGTVTIKKRIWLIHNLINWNIPGYKLPNAQKQTDLQVTKCQHMFNVLNIISVWQPIYVVSSIALSAFFFPLQIAFNAISVQF